jgi:iron only hydrogenase large subunit-like protein/nitrogen-specific signal transduction histidine kinase
MSKSYRNQLVYTIKDHCRVCYTCVRECPVKAIQIINGQAQVVNVRCIGCGNCVRVCSQGAKIFLQSKYEVHELLESSHKVAAIVAPSFPAEFDDVQDYKKVVGMIRALGFSYVCEVAFGADLVAIEYAKHMNDPKSPGMISSDCPAISFYVKHYHPEIIDSLSCIVSPMVAMTRVVHEKYGSDVKVVFIGPCVAKKAESREVDEVLTFKELREILVEKGINPEKVVSSDFDPPFAGKGSIFPVSRGLLQTTNIREDLTERNIIIAEGANSFKEAIREFETGLVKDHHLELLCCKGCIMGPGMSKNGHRYARRTRVGNYVKKKLTHFDEKAWQEEIEKYSSIDLQTTHIAEDRRIPEPSQDDIEKVLQAMGKYTQSDHLNCGSCGYDTCQEHAVAIALGFAEIEMCLPYSIEKLHRSIHDLNISNENLASAKQALQQTEKLAHMGQLSAGIAHELNNPLGVITMYSNILMEETSEEDPTHQDLKLIVEQANRCKKIVGGLLNFARKNQVNLTETDVVEFTHKSIESIIHPETVKVVFKPKVKDPHIEIDRDQMMQVLTNLEKNAIEAMPAEGGELRISITDTPDEVSILLEDTGTGIIKENMDKIFTPFFTTKELGKGTGLGLPLIYGIVKMHKGKISVTSNADPAQGPTGTTFIITLPRK